MSTSITLRGITKRFASARAARTGGSSPTGPAVDHVDLVVEPGELFFLLGPSGCGKTTLLRMIAGFIEPSEGSITFTTADGRVRDVTHLPPNKRNTGMVFQSYALWPHMTVEANVAFGLSVRRVESVERRRRAMEALGLVQMADYAGRKPTQLSGGQQQRVALARALVVRPDVLLLDEPLSNLDAKLRIELRSEIRRICKEAGGTGDAATRRGMTTVYVTHDQKEALSMADRIAIMRSGRVVQMGTPGDLYRSPSSRFVAEFLGETNFIEATVRGVDAPGGAPTSGAAGRLVTLETPAGVLRSLSAVAVGVGDKVTCSVRPEALRFSSGPVAGGTSSLTNRLPVQVLESTYLGEMAQQVVSVSGPASAGERGGAGGVRLKASILNPRAAAASDDAALVTLIEPEDVVLVRE